MLGEFVVMDCRGEPHSLVMKWRKLLYTTSGRESVDASEMQPQRSAKTNLVKPKSPNWLAVTTYAGILSFSAVYFFRPEDLFPALSQVPLAKICGLITAMAFITELWVGTVQLVPEVKLFLAFFAWICLAVPGSVYKGGSFDQVSEFSKAVLIIIATMCATTTVTRLRYLILLQIAAMIYLAILARGQDLQGGRMFGFGPMFGDPNDLALNFCMVLPFCVGFLLSARWFWKVVSAATIGILVVTIFATYSRGGFLALVAVCVAMVREFRLRTRTVAVVVVLVVGLSAVAILRVGADAYFDRLRTIANPQADVTGSAQARQRLLIRSLEETVRHPLLGVGPGVFYTLSGDWHQSHNTFLQLTSECGIPSLILFFMLIRRAFKNSKVVEPSGRPDEVWYHAAGLRSAMVGYLVGGFFLGTAYWLQPYLLFAYSVALRRIDTHSSELTEELHPEQARLRPPGRSVGRPGGRSGYRGRNF